MFSRKKLECPKCHRLLKQRCFIFNKKLKEKICSQCNKKIGTNIFYIEVSDRKNNDIITKYNLSNFEKRRLHKQLMDSGMSYKQAWRRINMDVYFLKKRKLEKQKKMREFAILANQERKKDEEQNKKFLKGLKNG